MASSRQSLANIVSISRICDVTRDCKARNYTSTSHLYPICSHNFDNFRPSAIDTTSQMPMTIKTTENNVHSVLDWRRSRTWRMCAKTHHTQLIGISITTIKITLLEWQISLITLYARSNFIREVSHVLQVDNALSPSLSHRIVCARLVATDCTSRLVSVYHPHTSAEPWIC